MKAGQSLPVLQSLYRIPLSSNEAVSILGSGLHLANCFQASPVNKVSEGEVARYQLTQFSEKESGARKPGLHGSGLHFSH